MPLQYKKALITGGAGFIGSHIARRLLELGMEVSIIDDLSMGKLMNIPKGAVFYHGSILDQIALREAFEGVDIVFHNAAKVSIRNSFENVSTDAEVNLFGTIEVLKEAGRKKIKKIIYASSMAVYGNNQELPIKETNAADPSSPYGVSKFAGEKYTRLMADYYGFESVILRYFNTYGPMQTLTPYVGVITIFISNLLNGKPPVIFGSGGQVRDFISVYDITEANMLAMSKSVNGRTFNIGTGIGTSVNAIADILIKKIDPKVKPLYVSAPIGEPMDSVADITEAKSALGFEPKRKLSESIDAVVDWNRSALSGGGL